MPSSTADLLPGYHVDPDTGAFCSLPWPDDVRDLPPSLGPSLIRFGEDNFVHHLTGQPWRFTRGQKRFLHLWYAYDDERRHVFRSGVKRGAKGTGKDPFGAAFCLLEMIGPVSLSTGRAHGVALVQVAANSEAQGMDLLRVAGAMLPKRTREAYGIEVGKKQIQCSSGSRIEIITASEASAEGDPATAIVLNESHHMTESSGGHAVAAVARRNAAKSPDYINARILELTNAHRQGMDSEAERSFEAWQAQVSGKAKKLDILYDSVEAPPDTNLYDEASLMRGLRAAYMDAPWSNLERLRDEIWDTRTSVADTIRFYLNGLAAAEDAWVDPRRVNAKSRHDITVDHGERISLALDCSFNDDDTGLVASRLSDGHTFVLGHWRKPKGKRGDKWLVPREEVDAAVRAAFADYQVTWFGADPGPAKDDDTDVSYWLPMFDEWHRDFHKSLTVWASPGAVKGHSVLFDLRMSSFGGKERNRQTTEMAMELGRLIDDENGSWTHDGNPQLVQHLHNAKRRPNMWGVSIGKTNRDSPKKIDLAMTAVISMLGRRIVLNSGKLKKRKTGRVITA